MIRALAWAAAWFTPSAALAYLLWATGQNPAPAFAYGWLGIAGAAGYVIVNGLMERRRRRAFDEELAARFLSPQELRDGVEKARLRLLDED